jgi:hypothetical protein
MCMALGSNAKYAPTAARWNGKRWSGVAEATPLTAPAPNGGGGMGGLSCMSGTFCMAVGGFQVDGANLNYAEKWNGIRWSLLAMVSPAHASSTGMNQVSCFKPKVCVSVGWYQHKPPGPGARPEAEVWKGASWSWMPTA